MMNCLPISWREQVTSNVCCLTPNDELFTYIMREQVTSNDDCYLTPNDELFTYIMARTSYIQ